MRTASVQRWMKPEKTQDKRGTLRWVAGIFGSLLVVYVGSFLLLVLDVAVLEAGLVARYLPGEAQELVNVICLPLIWLYAVIVD